MKVIHVINDFDPSSGGAERLVVDLHHKLLEKGFESELIGIRRSSMAITKATHLGLSGVYNLKAFTKVLKAIRAVQSENSVVHAHLFPTIFYLAMLKFIGLLNLKLLYTEHSTSNRRRDRWWGKLVDRFVYHQIDHVITISQGTKDQLCQWIPSIASRCNTIYNGVPLRFDSLIEREQTGKSKLLSIGRLTKAKNYENMLKALALLNEDFHYDIVGDGELKPQLQAKIQQLGLSDKVSLEGYVEDPATYLQEADIFLIVSSWEGFGMAAVEAMNAGLPVVASDIAGLSEIFTEGGALLVQPERPKEIAKAIEQLFGDKHLRGELANKGFKNSFKFSTEKMTQAYLDFYRQIA